MRQIKGWVIIDCWDNGGATADRYSIAISGLMAVPDRTIPPRMIPYTYFLCSSSSPYHPQGVGMHVGEMTTAAYKLRRGGWRHLGKRIDFMDLPPDVRRFVAGEFMPEKEAAAPGLLKALVNLYDDCVGARLNEAGEMVIEDQAAFEQSLLNAKAAINKARGKQ